MKPKETTLFDEFLTNYENQLLLFEELAIHQFSKLEDLGLTELQNLGWAGQDDAEGAPIVELNETDFSFLDEAILTELKINL